MKWFVPEADEIEQHQELESILDDSDTVESQTPSEAIGVPEADALEQSLDPNGEIDIDAYR